MVHYSSLKKKVKRVVVEVQGRAGEAWKQTQMTLCSLWMPSCTVRSITRALTRGRGKERGRILSQKRTQRKTRLRGSEHRRREERGTASEATRLRWRCVWQMCLECPNSSRASPTGTKDGKWETERKDLQETCSAAPVHRCSTSHRGAKAENVYGSRNCRTAAESRTQASSRTNPHKVFEAILSARTAAEAVHSIRVALRPRARMIRFAICILHPLLFTRSVSFRPTDRMREILSSCANNGRAAAAAVSAVVMVMAAAVVLVAMVVTVEEDAQQTRKAAQKGHFGGFLKRMRKLQEDEDAEAQ